MKSLPHYYEASASARPDGPARITSPSLDAIASEPPREFDGSVERWSPETLAVAAVSDCFVLTFKAIAATSKLAWSAVACDGVGTVDRSEGSVRFTGIHLKARLMLPPGSSVEKAARLLEKAKAGCILGNSFRFLPSFESDVTVEAQIPATL